LQKPLSWLIFGAGAIGTYIGGLLSLHGNRVAFIEKPEVAVRLRSVGLRLAIAGKQRHIPEPQIWTTLTEALQESPFDIAIFALKSYDTESALKNITPHRDLLPPLLCLQNGVENERTLAKVLGEDKIIAGTVTSAIARRAAGDVILERNRGMGISADHPLSATLSNVLNQADIHVQLYARAADMKWSKLLTNLLVNASSAILDMSPQEIVEDPSLFRLEIAQIREALAVMGAQHIRVVDLPGTPVRALSWIAGYLPARFSRSLLQSSLGKGRGGKMPSLHIDLHSGKSQSEVDWLNGAVVRFGEKCGVPTPVNRALNDTLLAIAERKIPPESYSKQPAKLIHLAGVI
jgi:2-dehydropantoate 2-reductase